jgi:hypothetical protein
MADVSAVIAANHEAFCYLIAADYARFIEIHTRHHTKQMPAVV